MCEPTRFDEVFKDNLSYLAARIKLWQKPMNKMPS